MTSALTNGFHFVRTWCFCNMSRKRVRLSAETVKVKCKSDSPLWSADVPREYESFKAVDYNKCLDDGLALLKTQLSGALFF